MTNQRDVIVGVFEDRNDAARAVDALMAAGFSKNEVGLVARNADASGTTTTTTGEGSNWAEGAAWGAAAGLGAGSLVGLGVLAGVIPVIGPVIAGGALATILANAAGGAVIGGLVGSLAGLGVPEEEARYYENEVHAGRYLVTVKAGNRASEAETILRNHKAYDFHRRSAAASATGTAHATTSAQARTGAVSGEKIQLTEEQLRARKTQEKVGEVRVHKEVITEHQTLNVPVQREEVVIERRAASGQAAGGIGANQEIRIPVTEERVHVEKQPVVKEEVTVGKQKVQDQQQVSGTVRKEEIKVEETGDVEVRDANKQRGNRNKK